jgi:hypothetical protein
MCGIASLGVTRLGGRWGGACSQKVGCGEMHCMYLFLTEHPPLQIVELLHVHMSFSSGVHSYPLLI